MSRGVDVSSPARRISRHCRWTETNGGMTDADNVEKRLVWWRKQPRYNPGGKQNRRRSPPGRATPGSHWSNYRHPTPMTEGWTSSTLVMRDIQPPNSRRVPSRTNESREGVECLGLLAPRLSYARTSQVDGNIHAGSASMVLAWMHLQQKKVGLGGQAAGEWPVGSRHCTVVQAVSSAEDLTNLGQPRTVPCPRRSVPVEARVS